MDLEIRVATLESKLAKYEAAAEQTRRGQVFQYLVDKWRISEEYEMMLELATDKMNAAENVPFNDMVHEAGELFKKYCAKAGKTFVEPGREFEAYIKRKRAEEEQQRKDAEGLKALMK